MRILMLAQFYPPYLGGEERHVQDLSIALAARGHSVAVATLWHAGLPEFTVEQGVRIYRIRGTLQRVAGLFSDGGHRHAPPLPDPELVWALRQLVGSERPEIVHAHNWLIYSFLPLKTWSSAKLILSVHDHSVACPKKKLIRNDELCTGPSLAKCLPCAGEHYGLVKGVPVVLAHRVMTMAEKAAVDLFLPVSHAVAVDNDLVGHGLALEVIPNFVPPVSSIPDQAPHPLLAGLPPGDFMLFVGAFARYKGLDVLLRAYADLTAAPPLVVIGYQTTEYPLRTIAMPPNVIVLQDWPHAAVMQAWSRCMLGLVPSIWSEPFGIVAIEAMAAGRPVIASRIGGLTEIVLDGATGLLVPAGEHEALRDAMQRLIGDPDLRLRMGQAGRQRVSDFQASAVVPRIEQIYRQLLHTVARTHASTALHEPPPEAHH